MGSCSSVRARKFLPAAFSGRYRKNIPLKINYSCIGIKNLNSVTARSVNITFFTYSGRAYPNLLGFLVCNFGNNGCTNMFDLKGKFRSISILNFNIFKFVISKENNKFFDES